MAKKQKNNLPVKVTPAAQEEEEIDYLVRNIYLSRRQAIVTFTQDLNGQIGDALGGMIEANESLQDAIFETLIIDGNDLEEKHYTAIFSLPVPEAEETE